MFFTIKKPFVFSIFGASGDLAKIKLFPSIYALAEQKRFPKDFYIVGYARTKKTRAQFRKEFINAIKENVKNPNIKLVNELAKHVYYFSGQYDKLEDFKKFRSELKQLTKLTNPTHLAYFSVPPTVFENIIENLGESRESVAEDLRLIIEKPFGLDTKSANELYHFICRYFKEEQVYLLDHYLGKSPVQSILHLRHSNRMLNLMMKGPEIANIQITAFEDLGIKDRVGYFEQVGIIKDMIQSHLLQILGLMTMSIPISDSAPSYHREKQTILSALSFPRHKDNLCIGQYKSYKKLKGVPTNSRTETFASLRFYIDRESWHRVPIYIRTGKKLNRKCTYFVIEFKKFSFQPTHEEPNRLVIELQPEERINIYLINKVGATQNYEQITTSHPIACLGENCLPEHGFLLLEVFRKRRRSFLSFPEIISSWEITDAVTDFIKQHKVKVRTYEDNSEGPKQQHKVTEQDGFKWFDICKTK